jgi:hypothetical protein
MSAIRFNHESVGSVVGHWARDGKTALLQKIPDLIRDGVFLETQPRNDQGLLSYIFAAKSTVDGKPYVIGFVVREDVNGRRYYDHSLTEITALDREDKRRGSLQGLNPVNRESISDIVHKHLGVKLDVALQQPGAAERIASTQGEGIAQSDAGKRDDQQRGRGSGRGM